MFEIMKDFELACEDVSRLQQAITKALKMPLGAGLRTHLEELNKSITDTVAEARVALPKVESQMNEDFANLKKSLDEVKQDISATQQELDKVNAESAANLEKAAAMPPAGEAPIDPGRGALLRKELLERFAKAKPTEAKPVDLGSIARHWDESEEAQHPPAAPPAPPAPPTPPAPATPGSGIFKTVRKKSIPPKSAPPKNPPPKSGDAWEGLSQADE